MTKYSFPPLVDENCTILILGSLPGDESLAKKQYYAHPRNVFWRIMFDIFEKEYTDDYSVRCQMLLDHHVALWDMIHHGNRTGSLDADIKYEIPNDLKGLLKDYPNISKIVLNGKKAEATFKKNFKDISAIIITMPSTSPANARIGFLEKLNKWKSAL